MWPLGQTAKRRKLVLRRFAKGKPASALMPFRHAWFANCEELWAGLLVMRTARRRTYGCALTTSEIA
jgi:hypothetical protein